MSQQQQEEEEEEEADEIFSTRLPLERVLEYLPLESVLISRKTCHALAEAADALAPRACALMLYTAMKERNILFVNHNGWNNGPLFCPESIAESILLPPPTAVAAAAEQKGDDKTKTSSKDKNESETDAGMQSSSFDILLRCFRVMQFLPNEVVIAFNGRYGRHCLPIGLVPRDDGTKTVDIKCFPMCDRTKSPRERCSVCAFRIPTAKEAGYHGISTEGEEDTIKGTPRDIYQHVQIHGKKGCIDLTRFYNVCAPNLPSDLLCPLCRDPNRTLLLTEVSYESSSTPSRNAQVVLLTYTPNEVQNHDGHASSLVFPPSYDDASMQWQADYPHRKLDSKHALSIHCVACKRFAIVSPASPCPFRFERTDGRKSCLSELTPPRDRALLGDTVLGTVFVRTKCAMKGCDYPVACLSCTSRDELLPSTDGKAHCHGCEKRFCYHCITQRQDWFPLPNRRGWSVFGCRSCLKKRRNVDPKHHDQRTLIGDLIEGRRRALEDKRRQKRSDILSSDEFDGDTHQSDEDDHDHDHDHDRHSDDEW